MNENIERNLENERLYRLGEQDGGIQQLEKTVINMYKNNMSLETISKINEISVEEVEKIIFKYQNNN